MITSFVVLYMTYMLDVPEWCRNIMLLSIGIKIMHVVYRINKGLDEVDTGQE